MGLLYLFFWFVKVCCCCCCLCVGRSLLPQKPVLAALPECGCVWFLRTLPASSQRYDVTWKPFPQTSLFSPLLWQVSTNIFSWADPSAGNISWHAGNALPYSQITLSSEAQLAVKHLWYYCLLFSICWTFILYLFRSHFSSIMEPFYLTILLVQFLPLCNFTWTLPILSRIYFYRSFALCCFPFVSLVYSGRGKSNRETDSATSSYSCCKTAYSGKSILQG